MSDKPSKRFNIVMACIFVPFLIFMFISMDYENSKKCVEWEEVAEYNGLVGWVTGSEKLGRLAAREKTKCRKWEKEWIWE